MMYPTRSFRRGSPDFDLGVCNVGGDTSALARDLADAEANGLRLKLPSGRYRYHIGSGPTIGGHATARAHLPSLPARRRGAAV